MTEALEGLKAKIEKLKLGDAVEQECAKKLQFALDAKSGQGQAELKKKFIELFPEEVEKLKLLGIY